MTYSVLFYTIIECQPKLFFGWLDLSLTQEKNNFTQLDKYRPIHNSANICFR